MYKIPSLLPLIFLFSCAETVHVEVDPESTTVTVPAEIVGLHENSPLSQTEWITAQTRRSVPVFPSGTSEDVVRAELAKHNLKIVSEWRGYLVVREGIPLIDVFGGGRLNYLYGFNNERLTLGPQNFEQLATKFLKEGLTPESMQVLHMFANSESDDAGLYDRYAWLLATHPDPRLRDGQLAIEFAQRAIEVTNPPYWTYVDTLAAAYAAAGDYENAVKQQRRAIGISNSSNKGALKRLQLFSNGQIYVSSVPESFFEDKESYDVAPTPRENLMVLAVAGSVDAQWTLATFYIENEVVEDFGIEAPGIFWMKAAAENGHPYAANEVGYCFQTASCGAAQDLDKAPRWFRTAIEGGDLMAALNLGLMYVYGDGAPHDDVEATRLLAMAANDGINLAAFNVALRYGEGFGAPPNIAAQRKFLSQIESVDYGIADYLIDEAHYYAFPGVETIAAMLHRAAVPPDKAAETLMTVANMFEDAYESGGDTISIRMTEDATFEYSRESGPRIVFNLIRISAALGSPQAQLRMAEYFEIGDIVRKSLSEANYWRQRAEP